MADLHGAAGALAPLKGIDVDLVAFSGDLHNLEAAERARLVAEALASLGPPVLIVPGNMDPKTVAPRIWKNAGLWMIHGRSHRHGEYGFVGVGGIVVRDKRRLSDPNRFFFDEEEVFESLSKAFDQIYDCSIRIVLTHQPPQSTRDRLYNGDRAGSVGIRRFVEEREPELLLCGHIHEDRGEAEIGSTKVANVGEMRKGYAAIIDLEGDISIEWIEPR